MRTETGELVRKEREKQPGSMLKEEVIEISVLLDMREVGGRWQREKSK